MGVLSDDVVIFFFVFRNDTKWGERLHTTYEAKFSKDTTMEERLAQYQNYIFKRWFVRPAVSSRRNSCKKTRTCEISW